MVITQDRVVECNHYEVMVVISNIHLVASTILKNDKERYVFKYTIRKIEELFRTKG